MADHDNLLARKPTSACRQPEWGQYVSALEAALRAALATPQPQPLFEGRALEFCQHVTRPTQRVAVFAVPVDDEQEDT